jgi:hypothetical protein
MGFEKGTVFFYENTFWLFADYSTDKEHNQTYILHGLDGQVIEVRERDCVYVISPMEFPTN